MKKQKKRYKLAPSNKWMERESTGMLGSCVKIPNSVPIYKLKTGKVLLDVIPYEVGKGNPKADEGMIYWERTFWVHRGIGPNQSTYVCPALTLNKPCPVCEERARIMQSDPSDEEFKAAKALNAKEWQIIQLYDRGDTEKGIQLLVLSYHRFGNAILESIEAGDEPEKLQDFWHPDGGHTLRVFFTEDSMGTQKFIRATRVDFKEREMGIPVEMDEGYCLDDLLIIPEYKKLKSAFLSGAGDQDDKPKGKSKAKARDEDEDEEDDEDDDDGDLKPQKSKGKGKSKVEEDDDDEDLDDFDDDDEDDDPKPHKSKKLAGQKREEEEPDEDDEDDEPEDDDEDDEPDEDDEEDSPKARKAKARVKKSKAKDEDDEDEPEDEEDEEPEDDEDDDVEPDDEDEDEEDPKPRKGKRKSGR